MNNLTYRELAELIQRIPEDHQDDNVTVYLKGDDEYFPVDEFRVHVGNDVLDNGHPFLTIPFA